MFLYEIRAIFLKASDLNNWYSVLFSSAVPAEQPQKSGFSQSWFKKYYFDPGSGRKTMEFEKSILQIVIKRNM